MATKSRPTVHDILEAVLEDKNMIDENLEDEYDFNEPMMEDSDEELCYSEGDDDEIANDENGKGIRGGNGIEEVRDENEMENEERRGGSKMDDNDDDYDKDDYDDDDEDNYDDDDKDDKDNDYKDNEWSDRYKNIKIKKFNSHVGPTLTIPGSPLEVFKLFFTTELLQMIVLESNRYAREVMGDRKYETWSEMRVDDISAFLGFSILMGINILPSMDDYWKRNKYTYYEPIASRISRDRFRELFRYLHFVDNQTLHQRGTISYDKLGKVRPLLQYLSRKFMDMYTPNKEVAVDEAMVKFSGRSTIKQYLPMKPIKRGIKVWVLGDSRNGYFSKFEVYTGKKGNSPEQGLGARVVKDLTSDLKGKHHHVYFDNFFTSVKLIEDLRNDGIYGCGTARADRKGYPQKLKTLKLSKR